MGNAAGIGKQETTEGRRAVVNRLRRSRMSCSKYPPQTIFVSCSDLVMAILLSHMYYDGFKNMLLFLFFKITLTKHGGNYWFKSIFKININNHGCYSTNGAERTDYPHAKIKLESYLTSYTKIKTKLIKNLNLRPKQ